MNETLSLNISKLVDEAVLAFIDQIILKYPDIDKSELIKIWNNKNIQRLSNTFPTICLVPIKTRKNEPCGRTLKNGVCGLHKPKAVTSPVITTRNKLTLKKHNKLLVYYHPDTNLVFTIKENE